MMTETRGLPIDGGIQAEVDATNSRLRDARPGNPGLLDPGTANADGGPVSADAKEPGKCRAPLFKRRAKRLVRRAAGGQRVRAVLCRIRRHRRVEELVGDEGGDVVR